MGAPNTAPAPRYLAERLTPDFGFYLREAQLLAQKLFDDLQAAFNPNDPHLHRVERA